MTKLDISKNEIIAEGGKALAEGLKGNQVMTELNIAGNTLTLNASRTAYDDMSGVTAVANAISGMGALTHLDASGNNLGQLVSSDGWEAHSNGTHYGQHGGNWTTIVPAGLQPLGIIAIANAIPDMGALIKLDVSNNHIGAEQEGGLQRICVASGIELAT
jgi:hypothetical protein